MQTTISRWKKLGTDAGAPWLSRASRQERCDIYVAYDGVHKFRPVGFILTEKGNADALVAYCPLGCDADVPDKQLVAELVRQLKIAVCVAEQPETARERDDVVWLGWVGSDDRPVPQWIYGLKCSPLSYGWDGEFVQLRPFCPHLFGAMARQPKAAAWLRRNQQKNA
jgi:hypothetical protein